MNKIAIFPGSFSPFTLGHKSVVDKALPLFQKIIISIGINESKNINFSIQQRENWIRSVYLDNPKIEVQTYKGLTVDHCKIIGAQYIIRGLRDSKDFEYEKKIAQTNKELNNNIETLFILTPPNLAHISSTIILEIIKNGGDTSKFLPKEVKL